jgi:hypothetical protein
MLISVLKHFFYSRKKTEPHQVFCRTKHKISESSRSAFLGVNYKPATRGCGKLVCKNFFKHLSNAFFASWFSGKKPLGQGYTYVPNVDLDYQKVSCLQPELSSFIEDVHPSSCSLTGCKWVRFTPCRKQFQTKAVAGRDEFLATPRAAEDNE